MPKPWVIKLSRSHRRRCGLYEAAGGNFWDGLTDVWAAYQPKGAASLAASYTDLSGNGHDAGVGVAPDWDASNGWKFNGIDDYLTTSFIADNDQSQTVLIQCSNVNASDTRYLFGGGSGAGRYFLCSPRQNKIEYWNGSNQNVAGALTAGNIAISGNQGYRNGVADGPAIGAYSGSVTHPVYIGCFSASGTPAAYKSGYIQALVICSSTNTAEAVATAAAAMAAL